MRGSWFKIKGAADETSADISIFSDIGGWGVSVQDFHDQLTALGNPDTLRIAIASDGGDVSTGFAIYNMLNRHPANKIVTVEGLAASMASVIAMAGDEIVMPSNSMLMIHNPWGSIIGESDQIASFADALASMQESIAQAYVARTGLDIADVRAMMNKETWLSAESAVEKGFADRVEEPVAMAASAFNLARFAHVPAALAKSLKASTAARPAAPKAATAATRQPNPKGKTMTKRNQEDMEFEGTDAAKTEEEIRAELVGQHKEIRALCKIAGRKEMADKFIDDNMSVNDVIAALDDLRKKEKKAGKRSGGEEMNAHNNPRNNGEPAATIDTAAIYGKWNSAGKRRAAA